MATLAVSSVPLVDRAHAAQYVAALTSELAVLVRRHQLRTLEYLLNLARLEAEEIAGQDKAGSAPSGSQAGQLSDQRK